MVTVHPSFVWIYVGVCVYGCMATVCVGEYTCVRQGLSLNLKIINLARLNDN